MPWGALAAGVASVAGSVISASGAKSAAGTAAAGQEAAAQVQQNMFDTTQKNLAPWMAAGGNALTRLQDLLGLTTSGVAGTAPTAPANTNTAPGTAGATAPAGGTPGAPGQFALPQPGQIQQFANGFSIVGNPDGSYAISGPGLGQPVMYPAGSDVNTIMTTLGNLGGGSPTAQGGTGPTPVYPTAPPLTPPQTTPGQPAGSGAPYGGFQQSPGYQYMLNQTLGGINNRATVNGGLNSGNTLKALQQNAYGLANQDWYSYLGQISNLSNTGQNAAANLGSIGATTATSIGNSLVGAANANAAGTIGATSAIGQGITNGVQNYFQQSYLNGNSPLNQNYVGAANPFGNISSDASNPATYG